MITPEQAEAALVCLLCLVFLTGGVLIGYLARPLADLAPDDTHDVFPEEEER